MYTAPSLVSELVYSMHPGKILASDANKVPLPFTIFEPINAVMVPVGGTTPTFADMLELELDTVFMVVREVHDLKHASEKNSFQVLSLDNRTDMSRPQFSNARAPMNFAPDTAFVVLGALDIVMCPK